MKPAFRSLFRPARRGLEERLRLALCAGGMAAWELDLARRERWWSAEMFALHGRAPGRIPEDYYALVHPDDRDRVREVVRQATHSCSDLSVQYRVLWPDGSVHWLEGVGTTLCDEHGTPKTLVGICVNIERRKDEEAQLEFLARASAELATLTDYPTTMRRVARLAVPHFADWCAVDMLDDSGRLQRVAVAHVDPKKVELARRLYERLPPDPAAPSGTWNVIRTAQPEWTPVIADEMLAASIAEPELLQAIRELGLHSYLCVPVVAHGTVLGAISFFTSDSRRTFTERDLAHATDLAGRAAVAIENAKLLDTLRQADAAKDVFLATLAHELRNPLSPLVNGLALLRRAPQPADAVPKVLPVLERQTSHLARLVDDLLDLARINSGKIELRRELLDLREVVRTALESSQPLIDQNHHQLQLSLPGDPVPVNGDAVRLAQVISNLLNNAARYTPAGGRIELAVRVSGQQASVCVSDTGIGIDARLLPHVFDLFTQAGAPHANGQGLGIGLYLVQGLVRLHGGEVQAESDGHGHGSRFTVSLPLAADAPPSAPAAAAPGAARASRVLVVEDNADGAQTLEQLLRLLGHVTAIAPDGASALQQAGTFAPDVVLLDIGLPDMNGYEVAQRLRAQLGNGVRLIALTGWGQAEDKRRALAAGFDEHWTKPATMEQLRLL